MRLGRRRRVSGSPRLEEGNAIDHGKFWGCLLLVVGLTAACSAPAAPSPAPSPAPTAPSASPTPSASPAPRADFAGLVDIGDGRRLYVECRGSSAGGSPTVVLISTGNASAGEWKLEADVARQRVVESERAVFPTMARRTRTCAYDRPGTRGADGKPTPSTRVPQPTTAQQGVDSLRTGLLAAGEPPPYVLAGGSWGGMIAQAFARSHPDEVRGLVLVDSASAFMPKELTAAQWKAFLTFAEGLDPRQYEVPDYPASIAALARTDPARAGLPVTVLSSSKPWPLTPTLPPEQTFPRWTEAQRDLAGSLRATQVSDTNSGHLIAIEQPTVVTAALTSVLRRVGR